MADQIQLFNADDGLEPETPTLPSAPNTYRLRISRLTIDKLGVKLYDRASAVVAELIGALC